MNNEYIGIFKVDGFSLLCFYVLASCIFMDVFNLWYAASEYALKNNSFATSIN
jgi:hypothetical protein